MDKRIQDEMNTMCSRECFIRKERKRFTIYIYIYKKYGEGNNVHTILSPAQCSRQTHITPLSKKLDRLKHAHTSNKEYCNVTRAKQQSESLKEWFVE